MAKRRIGFMVQGLGLRVWGLGLGVVGVWGLGLLGGSWVVIRFWVQAVGFRAT